jgi:hypothetical protein
VNYVKPSPSRYEKFKGCMEREKHSFKDMLCLDVATRWNSTSKMLEATKKCQNVYNLWKKKMGTLFLRCL